MTTDFNWVTLVGQIEATKEDQIDKTGRSLSSLAWSCKEHSPSHLLALYLCNIFPQNKIPLQQFES